MHLTYHTDYALRLLMLLAVEDARLHTIAEIARRYGVSRNHMMKISRTLVAAGFITPVRGRNGGLKLAAPAEKINLGAVISVTEDNFNLVECFDAERNSCVISANCGLRNPLRHALQAFLETLRKYTLQDLITIPGSYKDLRTLFGTEIAP
ncbi:Rrf2 family transcriptional regulator [Paremcibacter congregatus]|uniref:Rrf2 family transcriptional regulator n=1 Tax=Paremcibacter congregatus TaxID=2043170 RepID=A0A2G4YR32_9PROT|nr:Rrf2 family transcriptional regulator [Paremcibacter congregatus]PHZ84773.1 Rrf2 family transcriptional regulator [Paremcibacter congregatus]QDE28895.1 Rrf2 family transcriptional regulator [Paremcibacter congregatus]